MLRSRLRHSIRTTLDLANGAQVRSARRRLNISQVDLARIVRKIGNSLTAIRKQVELEKAREVEKCEAAAKDVVAVQ